MNSTSPQSGLKRITQYTLVAFAALFAAHFLTACGSKPDLSQLGKPAPQLANQPIPARIFVIGGTSGIGLETVKLALARGHFVAAMARRPERMSVSHPNLTMLKGDVTEPADLQEAMAQAHAIVFTIGINPTREPVSVFSTGAKQLLSLMKTDGSQHLIMVSGIGAGDSRGHGGFMYDNIVQPLLLKTLYEDKDRSEALIKNSEVPWTIVRPGFLVDTDSKANYRVIESMEGVTSGDIARADVAHYLLSTIEAGSPTGKILFLSN